MDEELANLQKEDLYSTLLRYGLYVAAVFQLIFLGACIFLPHPSPSAVNEQGEVSPDHTMSSQNTPKRPHFRSRRQDKKKRR